MTRPTTTLVLVALSLLLAGCASVATQSVAPTSSAQPTATASPSPSPSLSPTATPTAEATATPSPSPATEEMYYVANGGIVQNGPSVPTTFTIAGAWLVTDLTDYHWNNGQGARPVGTIGLRAADGTTYGPWQATGQPGQGGVPDAYWVAHPNIVIPAGTYTVLDSDPATWAQNAETGGAGMSWGSGIPQP